MKCATNWNVSSGSLESTCEIVESIEQVKAFLVDGLKSPMILNPTNGPCEITCTFEESIAITSISTFAQSRTCEIYYDDQYESTVKSSEETIENVSFYYGFLDHEEKPKRAKKVTIKFLSLIDKQNFSVYKIVFEKGQASQAPPPNPLGMMGANPKDMMMMMNLLGSMSMGLPGKPPMSMPPTMMVPPLQEVQKQPAEEPSPDRMQEMIDKSIVAMETRLSLLIEKKFEDLKLYIDLKFEENKKL